MDNQTLINLVDQEEVNKFLLSKDNIDSLQIYLYHVEKLQWYIAKHDELQTFLNNTLADQFGLDNSDTSVKEELNLQILSACAELKNMDSAKES